MAKIPIYQQRVAPNGQGAAANMQGARFISGEGQGFDAIASGLDKIAGAVERGEQVDFALEKDRIETEGRIHYASMSSDFDSKMRERLDTLKTSAQPGAPGFRDSYLSEFDKLKQETLQNAPSQYAKQLLAAHLARSREAMGREAFQFQTVEYQRNLGQQFDEGVKKDAAMVYANPAAFESAMGKWGMAADGFKGEPAIRAKLREIARNDLAKNAVLGWIDKNPRYAAQYMEGIIGDANAPAIVDVQVDGGATVRLPVGMLDQKDRLQLLEHARQKSKETEAKVVSSVMIVAAQDAVAKAGMLPNDTINLPAAKAAAVKAARESGVSLTPEQVLQLEGQVEKVAADRERDTQRARDASVAGVFQMLDQNGGDYQAAVRDAPWIATAPTEIRTRINDYAGKVATGATRPTDWQAYNALVADPATLKATNLDAMADKFSAQELKQLKAAQKKLIEDPAEEQNIVGTHALVKGMLDEAGFKKNEKKQAQFFSLLQQAVDQELQASGKKSLPQTRIREIASDLLVKEITSRGVLWDSKDEAFEIKVPDTERPKIEAALRAQGLPVNDYNVLSAYRRKLKNLTAPK